MSKEPTKREEAESNEDKARQAQKQGGDKSEAVQRTEQQQTGIPKDAIVDPGTPSINEPPGSDVIPPETKAAVEQANRDLEKQAQDAAKSTAQQQQQPGSEQEIADKRRQGQQVPPPSGKPGDDDDEDKKGKRK